MAKEYFPEIGKIPFEGPESKNPMAFHYYDAERVVAGKKMKDWMRFAMAWWHTLCAEGADQFGGGTKTFPWNQGANAVEIAKNKHLPSSLLALDENTISGRTGSIPNLEFASFPLENAKTTALDF